MDLHNPDILRAQNLMIQCRQLWETECTNSDKAKKFHQLVREEWDFLARTFKTYNDNNEAESDRSTIAYLNNPKNANQHHFARHLGDVLLQMEKVLNMADKNLPKLVGVHPDIPKLEQPGYAGALFAKLLETELPTLSDKWPMNQQLIQSAAQYQRFVTLGVISVETGLKELMGEISFAAGFAKKLRSSEFSKLSGILELANSFEMKPEVAAPVRKI